ncbi:hypothetical protein V513_11020 [Mesotoga sp. H07.pep.5.3]|nr:hypothetical protein V513_11020 [Mesotoga sp. H07.pep.5.3]
MIAGVPPHAPTSVWIEFILTCNSQLGTALLNARVISKAKIGSFPAKLALRPGAIFASIATWDVLPSLASADAFRRLASYSVLSNALTAIPDHGFAVYTFD